MKKILILAANPSNASKLRLDQEVREIEAGLQRCKYREQFQIISKWAVRPDTLRQALLDHEPQIVHFCGHGSGVEGLALENQSGQMQLVSTSSLAGLFALFKGKIDCVVLNACYGEIQAEAIYEHVGCVIGMKQTIGDNAAIEFAKGFYDGLGAGRTLDDAFHFGCNAIDLEAIPESSTPIIKSKSSHHLNNQNLNYPNVSQSLTGEPDTNQKLNKIEINNQESASISRDILLESPPIDLDIQNPINTLVAAKFPLENPEGQVPLNSPFYVERPPNESDCYETILQSAALIRIKAPRQLGKTSLMSRVLHHAKSRGYQTVSLNFQSADAEFLGSLDGFLQWFCASIADSLNLADRLDEYWRGILGSKNKCTRYFERYLFAEINSPIALGLDEVDQVFKHPEIASDFFGLLRAWHERAKNEVEWQKLALIIVHSKEVYIPLNINQSPFNVGVPIELPDLNREQVQDLIQRHGLNFTDSQVEQLINLVDGHPYLLRMALYQIARGRITLERLIEIAPTEEGPYSDHLRRHLLNLQEDEELLAAFKRVVGTYKPVDVGTTAAFKLRSMGLVKLRGNEVMPLCNLYRQYFGDRLN
ncbi:AAA-like domain-containing protein [Calothrix sp. 336/3]|uniref:AAA-like domain-containing protein n=1 Tax=Calothrix sp. 336/3 TaxID=1337936 RepID=UPI0004E2D7B2|nr:AAA-like domain-containing protein [Calothrix sp. 336/3]AKG24514.1 adenylate cyclase [Calothrix sp. 336/3]